MKIELPRWLRGERRTSTVRGEYETSPHRDPVVWCIHEDGRKHLPDEPTLPCPLGNAWVLCGVSGIGLCWRPMDHPGRHSNGQRTWPNDGPEL